MIFNKLEKVLQKKQEAYLCGNSRPGHRWFVDKKYLVRATCLRAGLWMIQATCNKRVSVMNLNLASDSHGMGKQVWISKFRWSLCFLLGSISSNSKKHCVFARKTWTDRWGAHGLQRIYYSTVRVLKETKREREGAGKEKKGRKEFSKVTSIWNIYNCNY